MEYIIWGVGLVGILVYSFIMLIFLRQLHKEGLLLRRKETKSDQKDNFVYFFQDVLDVFWLILLWLPLTFLACAFAMEVRREDWLWVLLAWSVFMLLFFLIATASTHDFNKENTITTSGGNADSLVWSAKITAKRTNVIYYCLKVYICAILSITAVLTANLLILICQGVECTPISYAYALISLLVFLTFFIMNTLSMVAIDVKLGGQGGNRKEAELFTWWQCLAGSFLLLLFCTMVVLCLRKAQTNDEMSSYLGTIFQGSVIPLIPIIAQLVQIVSPVKK